MKLFRRCAPRNNIFNAGGVFRDSDDYFNYISGGRRGEMDVAAKRTNNFAGEVQADTVMGRGFRGEEGAEDLFAEIFGNPGTIVRNGDAVEFARSDQSHIDHSVGATGNRFDSVVQKVKESPGEFTGPADPIEVCRKI